MTDRAGAEHPSSSHVGQFWVHIDTNSQSPLRIKHQLPMGRGPENTSFIISLPISESTCPPPRNNLPLSPISVLGSWILEDSKLVLTHAKEKAAVIIPINPHLLLGPLAHTGSCTCPKGLSMSCSWYCLPCSKVFHIHSVLLHYFSPSHLSPNLLYIYCSKYSKSMCHIHLINKRKEKL